MSLINRKIQTMLNKKKIKLNSSYYLKKPIPNIDLEFTIEKPKFYYHTMYPESIINLKADQLDRRNLYPKTMIKLDLK